MTAAAQPDLFGSTPAPRDAALSGLDYSPEFITADEEAELIARIDAAPLRPFAFQQWEGKRVTASYGWSYDFTAGRIAAADPLPDWLLPIRDRAARFAGLAPDDLVQALLIRYDPGAGIGWHRNRPVFGARAGHLARRGRHPSASPAPRRRVRPDKGRACAAIRIPPDRRGAERMGAQHRPNGGDPLVDHAAQPCLRRSASPAATQ